MTGKQKIRKAIKEVERQKAEVIRAEAQAESEENRRTEREKHYKKLERFYDLVRSVWEV